jgi:hypothetical protein
MPSLNDQIPVRLRLNQVLLLTPAEIFKRALYLDANIAEKRWSDAPSADWIFDVLGPTGSYRVVLAQCPTNPTTYKIFSPVYPTWMTCGCDNFLYVWEYALASYGGSSILRGNGSAPIHTNPSLRIGTCKHCIAATIAAAKVLTFPSYTPQKSETDGVVSDLQDRYQAIDRTFKSMGIVVPPTLVARGTKAEIAREALDRTDEFVAEMPPEELAQMAYLFGDD